MECSKVAPEGILKVYKGIELDTRIYIYNVIIFINVMIKFHLTEYFANIILCITAEFSN